MTGFPPTLAAALERIAGVRPADYARSRNHLTGAVTRLSPYLTHGIVSLPQVLAGVLDHQSLDLRHKFIYELGWREYFHHVWAHRGDAITTSLHPGVLPDACYVEVVPDDVREARCGVPVIDIAVRTLYDTGYLHNHARMWLASYLVHLRKVSWRAGADWLYAHLLDGDLASNHLSWQWVAGTASHKPYLFNADNVARYAPPEWHSPGTVVDASYDGLDALARSPVACPAAPALPAAGGYREPLVLRAAPPQAGATAPQADAIAGRDVWLVHPWMLADPPADLPAATLRVGVYPIDFHSRWPWSTRRWEFVIARMDALTSHRWTADGATLRGALRAARSVQTIASQHLSLPDEPWPEVQHRPVRRLFGGVDRLCPSFSQWWTRVTRGLHEARDLPGLG